MTNPAMEVPSEKAENNIKSVLIGMEKTANDIEVIRRSIGLLRSELNDCRSIIASLRAVIGPDCYVYNSLTTWQSRIDERLKKINAAMELYS